MRKYLTILLFAISSLAHCQQDGVIVFGDSGKAYLDTIHKYYWTPDSVNYYGSDFGPLNIIKTGQYILQAGDTTAQDSVTMLNNLTWAGDTSLFYMPVANLESFAYLYEWAQHHYWIKFYSIKSVQIIYKKQ